MMTRPFLAGTFSLLLCAQSFPAQEPGPGTDGQYRAPQTEAAYRFDCGDAQAELRWREERFLPESSPALSDTLRVTLLQFALPGRSVADADLARVRSFFDRLAWVEQVESWCYEGNLQIHMRAMPKREWIAYLERSRAGGAERPRASMHAVAISPQGAIRLAEPE